MSLHARTRHSPAVRVSPSQRTFLGGSRESASYESSSSAEGFAGIAPAKSLRSCDADLTLIDRRNQPLLNQFATDP
jgi:hypothetical protein